MTDLANLAPVLAQQFGVQPSTLVLLILIVNQVARMVARSIPNDAIGGWGFVRQIASVLGTEVANKITKGVTAVDVLKAVRTTPPIPDKIAAEQAEAKS